MKSLRGNERGVVSSAAAITLLSVVLGGGAAAAAIASVVSSSAPNDTNAVQTGPKDLVNPDQYLGYGG